jgi:hypothetical protein
MLHQSSTEAIGAGSCWLFLLLGWAGLGWAGLLLSTTLCLQQHKNFCLKHTCKTAQQQDVSTAKERGVGPCPSAGL